MSNNFLNENLVGTEVEQYERSVIKANLVRLLEGYNERVRISKSSANQSVYLVFVDGNHVWDFNPFLVDGNGVSVAVQKIEDSLYQSGRLLLG